MVPGAAAWSRRLLLGSAALGLLVAALDAYVVVTLLPAMLYDLDLSVDRIEQATPIVSGFLGGYIVVMPLLGLASDVHGRVAVYLVALALFAAGSVLTAVWEAAPVVPPAGTSLVPSQHSSFRGTRTARTFQDRMAVTEAWSIGPFHMPLPWMQANSPPDRLTPSSR